MYKKKIGWSLWKQESSFKDVKPAGLHHWRPLKAMVLTDTIVSIPRQQHPYSSLLAAHIK